MYAGRRTGTYPGHIAVAMTGRDCVLQVPLLLLVSCYMLMQMLCLIGEAFDGETEEICGAVMNVRMKGDKIAVWTRDATNVDSNMKIG